MFKIGALDHKLNQFGELKLNESTKSTKTVKVQYSHTPRELVCHVATAIRLVFHAGRREQVESVFL